MLDDHAQNLRFLGRDYRVRQVGQLQDGDRLKRLNVLHYGDAHALVVREGVRRHGKAYRTAREVSGTEVARAKISDPGVLPLVRITALRGLAALSGALEQREQRLASLRRMGAVPVDPVVDSSNALANAAWHATQSLELAYNRREALRGWLEERGWLDDDHEHLPALISSGKRPPATELARQTTLKGVAAENADGTSRQDIIRALLKEFGRRPRLSLALLRERDNPHDSNAIALARGDHGILGHLPRELAAELAPHLDTGQEAGALLTSIYGGKKPGHLLGASVKITVRLDQEI